MRCASLPFGRVFIAADNPYIDCDAAFAVKDSLKADFVHHGGGIALDRTVKEPYVTLDWTFVLAANAVTGGGPRRL
ncbi:MAG: hypothetical protein J2P17_12345 [Mycobacterium sp.]|nr:hypothetical protein [Mycobacterium sp.]